VVVVLRLAMLSRLELSMITGFTVLGGSTGVVFADSGALSPGAEAGIVISGFVPASYHSSPSLASSIFL
jgi:hypothetical protein